MNAVRSNVNKKKRPEFHPFGQRARDDGGRGRHEHHLEKPVRHDGVAVLDDRFFHGGIALEQGDFFSGRTVEEFEGADPRPDVHVHQVVADREVGEPGDRVEADVLQTDDGCVLRADGPGLQHREAGAHPHHQRTPDQERKGVEDEIQFPSPLSVIGVIIANEVLLSIRVTGTVVNKVAGTFPSNRQSYVMGGLRLLAFFHPITPKIFHGGPVRLYRRECRHQGGIVLCPIHDVSINDG